MRHFFFHSTPFCTTSHVVTGDAGASPLAVQHQTLIVFVRPVLFLSQDSSCVRFWSAHHHAFGFLLQIIDYVPLPVYRSGAILVRAAEIHLFRARILYECELLLLSGRGEIHARGAFLGHTIIIGLPIFRFFLGNVCCVVCSSHFSTHRYLAHCITQHPCRFFTLLQRYISSLSFSQNYETKIRLPPKRASKETNRTLRKTNLIKVF